MKHTLKKSRFLCGVMLGGLAVYAVMAMQVTRWNPPMLFYPMANAEEASAEDAIVTEPDASSSTSTEATTNEESPVVNAGVVMEAPLYRGLDANLYMQISAEYRACCIQAYRWARRIVHDKVIARVAAIGEPDDASVSKPPAVVMDLDETVLDNRLFQSRQIREGWAYNLDYWSDWELKHGLDVGVVPGAVEFIQHIEALGIQPVYITNRNTKAHTETLAILERFGISVSPDLLLCADKSTGSNKDSRRQLVRERFDVLVYVGDNLRDFDNVFHYDDTSGNEGRKKVVDQHQSKFGEEWIILPNPAYGEWAKPLGKGIDDAKLLDPTIP